LSGDAPVAGVTVTIASAALQQPRTATTNAHGTFWFAALPPGTYDVTFAKAGLTSLTRPAIVEAGRVARADAMLEVSAEEESVTSTAMTINVATTPAVTTHFTDEELDRLPLFDDPITAAFLAPSREFDRLTLDGTTLGFVPFLGHEAVNQLTIFRAAAPAELGGLPIIARTQSGGEEFSLAVRDTYSRLFGEGGHLLESASGGRIVPERLWFFASGWAGDSVIARDTQGFLLKFTGQLAPAQNLALHIVRSELANSSPDPRFDRVLDIATLRYTGVANERTTLEAIAGVVDGDAIGSARLSYRIGDHVLTAGADRNRQRDTDALYVSDRWSFRSFTLDAGLRRESGGGSLLPRIAATYDVRGNGRQAITASFGESDALLGFGANSRFYTAGFITAIGTTGFARADYVRRERRGGTDDQLQFELRYSLFGRIQTGVNYGNEDVPFAVPVDRARQHRGNVWLGGQVPIGEHELGLTLLERYENDWLTDVACRYRLPVRSALLTLGADVTNAFAQARHFGAFEPRAWRFWARIAL
jgi:hypothetical protein